MRWRVVRRWRGDAWLVAESAHAGGAGNGVLNLAELAVPAPSSNPPMGVVGLVRARRWRRGWFRRRSLLRPRVPAPLQLPPAPATTSGGVIVLLRGAAGSVWHRAQMGW